MSKINAAQIAEIAAKLPGDWTVAEGNAWAVIVTRSDGLALLFHTGPGYAEGKGEVRLTGRRELTLGVRYDESLPAIGLSFGKKGAAADIVRRLLPDAEAVHATLTERLEATREREKKIADSMALLQATGALEEEHDSGKARVPSWKTCASYGDVSVFRDHVTIELHGVPLEKAARILEVIKKESNR